MFFGWAGKGARLLERLWRWKHFSKKRKGRGNFTEVKPNSFWGKLFRFENLVRYCLPLPFNFFGGDFAFPKFHFFKVIDRHEVHS